MDSSDDFFLTGLEKGKLNVRESHINSLTFNRTISESIQMALKITLSLFLPNTRPNIEISKDRSLTFININLLLLHYVLFCMPFTQLHTNLFLKSLHLSLQLSHSIHLLTSKHDFLDENSRLRIFRKVDSRHGIGKMEIESQRSIFSLIIFNNTLQNTNMKRHMLSIYR
jgi:hypothetical protein